jgi:diguanylate cyclase (GGDEF)-like protein
MSVYNVLYILLIFSFAMSATAMWINWHLNRHELAVRDWAIALSMTLVGCIMAVIARLNLSDPADMVPLNFFSFLRDLGTSINGLAWLVLWRGILRFMGRSLPAKKLLFGAWLCFFIVLLAGHPLNMPAAWGVAWISSLISVLSLMVLYEILRHGVSGIATWFASVGFSGAALTWGVRAVMSFLDISRPIDMGFDTVVMFGAVITTFACMMALILLTNQRLIDRLGNAAHRQNQAGVLSRRTFFDSVEPLLESSLANQQHSTIAILGIDNFSEINDTYGGKSGDLALGHVALMVMRILGRQDLLARNKGGEFLVFMYGKTAEQAKTLMNRLQVLLRQNVIDTERGSFQVILNVGIAEHRFDEGVLQTVTRASAALPAMELNDSLQGAG